MFAPQYVTYTYTYIYILYLTSYMSAPQYVNYGLPTLMLMAGLDGLPGGLAGSLTPACVPEVSLT